MVPCDVWTVTYFSASEASTVTLSLRPVTTGSQIDREIPEVWRCCRFRRCGSVFMHTHTHTHTHTHLSVDKSQKSGGAAGSEAVNTHTH